MEALQGIEGRSSLAARRGRAHFQQERTRDRFPIAAPNNEVFMKIVTLCLLISDGQVLLGMKKKSFGAGKWNGFGGKVEEGETVEAAAIREMEEESGILISPEAQV